jgi:hypothetical protein
LSDLHILRPQEYTSGAAERRDSRAPVTLIRFEVAQLNSGIRKLAAVVGTWSYHLRIFITVGEAAEAVPVNVKRGLAWKRRGKRPRADSPKLMMVVDGAQASLAFSGHLRPQ